MPHLPDPDADATPDFARTFWRVRTAIDDLAPDIAPDRLDDRAFRLFADYLPTLCWMARADGYIVWYNRRWHDYCGTTAEAMEGWGWTAVHDQAMLPAVLERWHAAIRNGVPFEMTFPLRGADGIFRPFLTRIQPVAGPDGQVLQWFGVNTEISAQVAAETALRIERDRSRDVLENMAESFVLLDCDYRVLDINAQGLQFERRPKSEIVGGVHWEVWPGSEQSELGALYKRAMTERVRVGLEHAYTWPDGRQHWFEMRAFPSGDGLAVFYRDVTERKAAEALLAASEARFRTVAEALPGFVWTADEHGQLDYTSPHWQAYSGTDPAQSDGQGWGDFLHPDDQARAFQVWADAVASSTPYEIEFRLRRADGIYRWWLGRARPIAGVGTGGSRWVGTCTDIDDIVAAREALSRSSAQLERLVQARTLERDRIWHLIPDLLMTGSLDGQLLSVNPAWRDALGYDAAALEERRFRDLFHPDDAQLHDDAVQRMAAGHHARFQCRIQSAQGQFLWFDWIGTPVGVNFHAIARDITERKAHEAELQQAQEALRQSQKMDAVGQLTGGIAHDFNNMLAVVLGSLQLLARRAGGDDERARRHIDTAIDAARRAALLTDRLLAFSRQQPLRPQVTDINRLVSNMSDLLRHSVGVDVVLETVLAEALWPTHVDQNQLESAILNLGVNARDAMPQGGRLTICTRNVDVGEGNGPHADVLPPGQYVRVSVADTGTGMPPEVLAKAFDPFFTTKEVGKGTGLGLSQVYGFVRQSGGHVVIDSQVGRGTSIELYLPRHAGNEADTAGVHDRESELPTGRPGDLVLVVEDEPAVRQVSVDALTELGYRVLQADGAASALALLDAEPDIRLLFTDVVMPGISGAQLAAQALTRRPALKVLFTTGYSRDADFYRKLSESGAQLIAKPFSIAQLANKLRQVLDA